MENNDTNMEVCMTEGSDALDLKSIRSLSQDMLDFEECLQMIGIETRLTDGADLIRNPWAIIDDVAKLTKNNPTLLIDIEGKDFKSDEEKLEFLGKYNFDGVTTIPLLKKD